MLAQGYLTVKIGVVAGASSNCMAPYSLRAKCCFSNTGTGRARDFLHGADHFSGSGLTGWSSLLNLCTQMPNHSCLELRYLRFYDDKKLPDALAC